MINTARRRAEDRSDRAVFLNMGAFLIKHCKRRKAPTIEAYSVLNINSQSLGAGRFCALLMNLVFGSQGYTQDDQDGEEVCQ